MRTFNVRRARFIALCLLPGVVFVALFTYYPVLRGAVMAFQQYNLFDLTSTPFVGLENFRAVLGEDRFWTALRNTGTWVVVSLFFQFFLGFGLALLLRRHFRGRGLYQAWVFFPWAMSGFLIGLLWRWMFNGQFGVINDLLLKTGIIDQRIGFLASPGWAMTSVIVANVWYGVTFFAIMIMAALQSVPKELYEAASVDGASRLRQFWHVTLPHIRPTLALIVLLRIIWILNFPDLIYSMTGGGPAGSTDIITTFLIQQVIGGDYGRAGAVGLLILGLLLSFSVFYLNATRFEKSR
ncbi:sugar ABC transporter permease [Nonomuraea sp. NBC_00507]|jgi:multiple sugar transport system permease protein|uniref:carbohydrate ABC transporter permease n=1 Tax=unclassified Nonomuraea TaxID=2593643 RepID=UPI00273C70E4|nr:MULTISPECIES: sugar ABC transporter permease [unclassified Nonomuraea]MDP4508285.1 sugar ABC transporter permease [Nonomuraea sp. G32]